MIIIAIALAAVVAFMVSKFTETDSLEEPDYIGLARTGNEPAVRVVHADNGLDWYRDFRIGGTCTVTLNGQSYPTAVGTPVRGNDVLGCQDGEELKVIHQDSNSATVIYEFKF
jgi:hypothetical protein